jgi:hypothetical protein
MNTESEQLNPFVSLDALAVRLGLPRAFLRKLSKSGEIPALNVNGRIRFDETVVREALTGLARQAQRQRRGNQVCTELQPGDKSVGGESKKLVWSILVRSALWLLLLAALECVPGYCAWRWGEGKNLIQKSLQCWPLFVVMFAPCALAYPFFLGRERWCFIKFWKGDDK